MRKLSLLILYTIFFIVPLIFFKRVSNAYFTIKIIHFKTLLFLGTLALFLVRDKVRISKFIVYYFLGFSLIILFGLINAFNRDFVLWAYSIFFSFFLLIALIHQFKTTDVVKVLILSAFLIITFGLIQKFVFSVRNYSNIKNVVMSVSLLFLAGAVSSIIFMSKNKTQYLAYSLYSAGISGFLLVYLYLLNVQNIDIFESFSRWERVYSTIGNPNYLSAFIIAALPFSIYYMVKSREGMIRHFLFLNVVLSVLLIFITKTRGALIAMTVAWGFAAFKLKERITQRDNVVKKIKRYMFFVVIALVPLIFVLGINKDIEYMVIRFKNLKSDPNIKTRYQTWLCAIDIGKNFLLFGGGLDNYQSYYPFSQRRITFIVKKKGMSSQEKRAHSEYLQFFAETGVLGLALFLILLIVGYKSTLFAIEDIRLYAFISMLSLYIHSIVSFPLHILSPMLVFALAVAILFRPDREIGLNVYLRMLIIAVLFITLIPQFRFTQAMQHTKYAEFYRSQNDWNNTNYYYKKSVKSFKPIGINYHYIGTGYYVLNDDRSAEQYFRKALRFKLRQEYLFANFGNVLANQRKYHLARDMYKWGIFIAPRYEVNYYNLANLFQTLNILKKAEFYYKRGLAFNNKNTDIWYNLGNLYFDLKNYDRAIACFKRVLYLKPDDIKALNNMAITYYKKGEKERGIKLLEQVIQQYPDRQKGYIDLATIYMKAKEFAKAEQVIKRGLEIKEDPEFYFVLGNMEYERKKYQKARKYYKRMIELAPNDPRGYNNLALVEIAMGNERTAIELYEKALEINPDYREAKSNYNSLLKYLKKKEGGTLSMEKEAYRALMDENYQRAIELYNKLLSKPEGATNFAYKINLGYAYYKVNDYTNAEKYLYEGLTDKKNEFFEKFNTLGNIYYRTNRPDSAIWAYKKVLAHDPDDYMAKYNLGAAYLAKGDFKRCYELWTEIKDYLKNDKEFVKNYKVVESYVIK